MWQEPGSVFIVPDEQQLWVKGFVNVAAVLVPLWQVCKINLVAGAALPGDLCHG